MAAVVISVGWWIFDLFFVFIALTKSNVLDVAIAFDITFGIATWFVVLRFIHFSYKDCIVSRKKKTIFVCFLDGTFVLNEHCLAHEHSTAYPSIHLKKIIPFDAHYIDSHHSINFIAFWCMCVFAVDSNAICHFCINSKYIKWHFVKHASKWHSVIHNMLGRITHNTILHIY